MIEAAPASDTEQITAGTVRLSGLTKSWAGSVAVDRLDLDVRAGEFLSILGPSGCGKTTTLRMIAGLESPDAGAIRVSGADITELPPYKRNVNTVFQSYALFPHMRVANNVAYGLRQRGVRGAELKSRVTEALDLVEMRDFANRRTAALSGGQQQRVALARAIINRPSVLLLDEPLAALDRRLREGMQIELKRLQKSLGMTFIFVTHDQQEALSMSDRIAIMRDGKLEQLATPDDIYDEPVTRFVADFIGTQNTFTGTLRGTGVDVNGRSVVAKRADGLREGDQVVAVVRPEAITVTSEESFALANRCEARVQNTAHLGDVLQTIARTEDGQELIIRTPRRRGVRMDVGETIWCSWSPEDTLIFPQDK